MPRCSSVPMASPDRLWHRRVSAVRAEEEPAGRAEPEPEDDRWTGPNRWMPHLRPLARPLAVYAASRSVVLAVFAIAAQLDGGEGLTTLEALGRWDSTWYVAIARDGYPAGVPEVAGEAVASRLAFFPLFPAAVRVVMAVTGLGGLEAALLANVVLGAVFAVLLWILARRLADDATADRAVALDCFFPSAFVLSMAYSEPLMLALAAACLLALLDRHWVLAGVTAALATATRPNALALAAACAWAAAVSGAGPTGLAGAGGFRVEDEAWDERFDYGRSTLGRVWGLFHRPSADQNVLYATLGSILAVAPVVLLWRWRPPGPVIVYTLAVVALTLGSATHGGRPRFVLTAFPLVMAAAVFVRGLAFTTLVAVSATLMAGLTVLTAVMVITP